MSSTRRCLVSALLVATTLPAFAQNYPSRPIRLIVNYPAGGATDVAARLVTQKLAPAMGQNVIVDNRAGASGMIGAAIAAHAEPDGHTLSFSASPELSIYRALTRNPKYDSLKDFQPVSLVARVPFMLVVHPSVQASSVKDLVALAKAKPGALNFASFGNGTSNHLVGEAFKTATGTNIVHVPYKGSAPAMADLLGGQVQMTFDSAPVVLPQVRAGKLRALAIAAPRRTALAPEVQTMDEAGVPKFYGGTWFGVLAPAKTPPAIVERLHKEIATLLRAPDVVQVFTERGFEAVGNTPAEFRAFIDSESQRWLKVAQSAGIKPE